MNTHSLFSNSLVFAIGIAILFAFALIPGSGNSTEALEKHPTSDLYERLEEFHGHTCGGSLMGARLGLAARADLDARGGSGKYKAEYFAHSCPVDGIQLTAGTTYGNRALTVHDRNDHRLVLTDMTSDLKVEVTLTEESLAKGKQSRALAQKIRELPAGSSDRILLEKEIEKIYHWFRSAEEKEVVRIVT